MDILSKLRLLPPESVEYTTHDAVIEKPAQAKWIPLGHRMGPMKHPSSLDWECPVCGYVAYTIFMLPPDICPRCKTTMEVEYEGED